MSFSPRRPAQPVRARVRAGALEQVEVDLAEERANALGRVSERLQEAIEDHELLCAVGAATPEQVDRSIDEIATAAWNLLVQRDCAGFRGDNRRWIREQYDIPPAALRRF